MTNEERERLEEIRQETLHGMRSQSDYNAIMWIVALAECEAERANAAIKERDEIRLRLADAVGICEEITHARDKARATERERCANVVMAFTMLLHPVQTGDYKTLNDLRFVAQVGDAQPSTCSYSGLQFGEHPIILGPDEMAYCEIRVFVGRYSKDSSKV